MQNDKLTYIQDFVQDFVFEKHFGPTKMRMTHMHPLYELFYFPKPLRQRLIVNGQEEICPTACIVISTPYTVHYMETIEDCPDDLPRYVLYFNENLIHDVGGEELFGNSEDRSFGLLFRLTEEEADYFGMLISQLDPDASLPQRKSDRERYIPFLIGRLFSAVPKHRISRIGKSGSYVQKIMQDIHDATEADVILRTDEIAMKYSVSRSKLERDFKGATGSTVREFINMCRINRVMRLIRSQKKLKMSEIASMCGFRSETYLFAFFKKYTGYSPKEYQRNKNIENNGLLSRRLTEGDNNGKDYLYGCR